MDSQKQALMGLTSPGIWDDPGVLEHVEEDRRAACEDCGTEAILRWSGKCEKCHKEWFAQLQQNPEGFVPGPDSPSAAEHRTDLVRARRRGARDNTSGTRFTYADHTIQMFKHLRRNHRFDFPFLTLREFEDENVYAYTSFPGVGTHATEEEVLAEHGDRIRGDVISGIDDEHNRAHNRKGHGDFMRHILDPYRHARTAALPRMTPDPADEQFAIGGAWCVEHEAAELGNHKGYCEEGWTQGGFRCDIIHSSEEYHERFGKTAANYTLDGQEISEVFSLEAAGEGEDLNIIVETQEERDQRIEASIRCEKCGSVRAGDDCLNARCSDVVVTSSPSPGHVSLGHVFSARTELPWYLAGSTPVPFSGSEEERRKNRSTHNFVAIGDPEDGEVRCFNCDARPSHQAANYPCGTVVPRQEI